MSAIGPKQPLLPATPRQKPSEIHEKIHAEDGKVWDEAPPGVAKYHDPVRFTVLVNYDGDSAHCYEHRKDFEGKKRVFASKDKAFRHEAARRLAERKNLPFNERYHGWNPSLWQKIKHLFGKCIDQELLHTPSNILKLHYSAVRAKDFEVQISPEGSLRNHLLQEGQDEKSLWAHSIWHHNGVNGYHYMEDGQELVFEGGVTSSNDRSSDQICMMRRYVDSSTHKTLSYTGRPDTESKAIEQIKFIFNNELDSREGEQRGLTINEDGSYTLTYLVNNLMSPVSGTGLVTYDEKAAVLKEQEILEKLSKTPLKLRGKTVHVKPIYFNEPMNLATLWKRVVSDAYSGEEIRNTINQAGYKTLLSLAEEKIATLSPDDPQRILAQASVRELKENEATLLQEELLFNRAILAHFLNIPIVNHCKSSTDRTIVSVALGTVAYQWNKLSKPFPQDKTGQIVPHLILQDEAAKELFTAHALGGHQVTRISRGGDAQDSRTLGFSWDTNPVIARLLPARYTKANHRLKFKAKMITGIALSFILSVALSPLVYMVRSAYNRTLRINPFIFRPTLNSPFAKRIFDHKSAYVGKGSGRSLIKPGGMVKLHF